MSQPSSDLANRRAEIDRIDREMHALLQQRAKVVLGVLRAKQAATAAGEVTPPFRPGREAEVLRKLVANHAGEFPAASLLRIWREIISGATRIQAVQRILVLGGSGNIWDLARDHFGLGAVYEAVSTPAEAFAALRMQSVAAAVLPAPSTDGEGGWWRALMQDSNAEGAPQIVARLPFFRADTPGDAIVLSPFAPDASSGDSGVLGICHPNGEAAFCAKTAAAEAGLSVASSPLTADGHTWLEVEGLQAMETPAVASLAANRNIDRVHVLGGYAVPLT